MRHLLSILVLLVLTGALAGCRSIPPAPPGFIAASGAAGGRIDFPPELSPEARFGLLSWYLETQTANADAAASEAIAVSQNAHARLLALFRERDSAELFRKYPNELQIASDNTLHFNPTLLKDRTDWEVLTQMFDDIREFYRTQNSVPVPLEECSAYLHNYRSDADPLDSFAAWHAAHTQLTVSAGNSTQDLELLERVEQAIALKRVIIDALAAYEEHLSQNDSGSALAVLDRCAAEVPPHASLQIIGDSDTLARYQRAVSEAPDECISAALRGYNSAEQPVEAALSTTLRGWQSEPRFELALKAREPELRALMDHIAALRFKLFEARLNNLSKSRDYWGMAQEVRRWLDDLETPAYDCLRQYGKIEPIKSDLTAFLRALLPDVSYFYQSAEMQALNIDNHFGLVLILDRMFADYAEAAGVTSSQSLEQSRTTAERARQLLFTNRWNWHLEVQPFTANEPGLGAALARDLAAGLRTHFDQLGWSKIIGLDGTPADFTVTAGAVAEYGELFEERTEERRNEQHYSAPLREVNPAYTAGAVNPPHSSPDRWLQELTETAIVSSVTRREAHIRISFELAGTKLPPVECNEFFKREFTSERVESTRVVSNVVSYRLEECLPQSTLAPLRQERLWSPAEMLDYARKGILELAELHISCRILSEVFGMCWTAGGFVPESANIETANRLAEAAALCEFFTSQPTPPENGASESYAALHQRWLELHNQLRDSLPELTRDACREAAAALQNNP